MDEHRITEQVGNFGGDIKAGVEQGVEAAKSALPDIETATGVVKNLAGQVRTAAVGVGSTIQDAAIEAGNQVGEAAAKVHQQGTRAGEYVSRNTAEQPLLALLVAGAIGYGIAYVIHARRRQDG